MYWIIISQRPEKTTQQPARRGRRKKQSRRDQNATSFASNIPPATCLRQSSARSHPTSRVSSTMRPFPISHVRIPALGGPVSSARPTVNPSVRAFRGEKQIESRGERDRV